MLPHKTKSAMCGINAPAFRLRAAYLAAALAGIAISKARAAGEQQAAQKGRAL